MAAQPRGQAQAQALARAPVEELAGQRLDPGLQDAVAGGEPGHGHAAPGQPPVRLEREGRVAVPLQARHARRDLAGQRPARGGQERFRVLALDRAVEAETEALQAADELALDHDLAVRLDRGEQVVPGAQAAHQGRRPAVDETLGQALVQGVGQLVLDGARALLPMPGVVQPIAAVGDVGPGADVGDARGERVDVAVAAVDPIDLARHPVLGQALLAGGQEAVDAAQQAGVLIGQDLLEVGDLADLPEQAHGAGIAGQLRDLRIAGERRQRREVVGLADADQLGLRRPALQGAEQKPRRTEVEVPVAPVERAQGIEAVRLDRLDEIRLQGADLTRGAEGPVGHVAPGAPGDLAHLGRAEPADVAPVELDQLGEGDVIQVQVEAHADGVGGDQIVDLAGLEHGDLGVARARAERAQHHGGAAALAAQELGHGVDLGRGEGDHGRARRQARQLARAAVGERREARPGDDLGLGHQPAQDRTDRLGAQEHGLFQAARVQQAVGEDVAPVRIGAELDLVDAQEGDRPVERHGFDGAQEVARARRQNLLLAGDQRHLARALDRDHPVVVLAREQAQGKPDHAAAVAEHALDGEIGLARVGRAEDGGHPAVGERAHGVQNQAERAALQVPARSLRSAPGALAALDQGHEGDGQHLSLRGAPLFVLGDQEQVLLLVREGVAGGRAAAVDRNHEPAAGGELVDQRRWDSAPGRRGHHDGLVGRMLRPAPGAVADARLDVGIAEPAQALGRRPGQLGHHLDAIDPGRQLRQDRRLIAAAGADFEHPVVRTRRRHVGHDRHDVRLGDRLAMADRLRPVGVGALSVGFGSAGFGNEEMSRDLLHGGHDPAIEAVLAEPIAGAGDLDRDLLDHGLARGCRVVAVHGLCRLLGRLLGLAVSRALRSLVY